ncbi:RrF2 family transcriptional regulator [Peptostreptococcus canis]|uniref:Rrf2 family transcriptional regulator n=1 Tax=Peptostreptococcus canis TaxID=1159213 RepID=A0ABR6TJL7_9FIRM|nr:Rrf2 family transcriptional regulator [Peptostreptococcus canis]MBC2575608.1 Rrf2 family transcriptional regulator [Peptostreptococcus canis]MBP1997188.1 DNA-binding IscR family transcriptional regulator [Peptostreptococcus canis]
MSEFIIALHVLVFLAHDMVSKSSEELSKNVCTNPVRIRKVMSKCKKHGLVETKAGINGGYMISKPGNEITLKDIYDAIDVSLVESKWRSGDIKAECLIASGMGDYIDMLFSYFNEELALLLDNITLDMVEQKLKSIRDNKV